MIDVYVDASLSRKNWGCAGVLIAPVAPLSFPTTEFTFGVKPGTNPNDGEMQAILHGARALRQILKLVVYAPMHTIIRIKTDSEACCRAMQSVQGFRADSFISLTKSAKLAWDRLRDEQLISGYVVTKIPRSRNRADLVARQGRLFYSRMYQPPCQNRNSRKSSGAS